MIVNSSLKKLPDKSLYIYIDDHRCFTMGLLEGQSLRKYLEDATTFLPTI
jgi:hypothetical protein